MKKKSIRSRLIAMVMAGASLIATGGTANAGSQDWSAARIWNEQLLAAIRLNTARPTVHARNLFHVATVMWDAWAAYDPVADQYLHIEKVTAPDVEAARHEAISYAAYRTLKIRFASGPNFATINANLDAAFTALGYNPGNTSTVGNTPAALGNRIAAKMAAYGLGDGANQQNNYAINNGYAPINPPLVVGLPGNPDMIDPNRWQPLAIDFFIDQGGIVLGPYPPALTPFWGQVRPFALKMSDHGDTWHNVPPQPRINGVGDMEYRLGFLDVVRKSSYLTPEDGVLIDISPATYGNNPLGTNDGTGYDLNPVTGQPYTPHIVKRGDFARCLAEFWADGPSSETPPGHWFTVANYVSDNVAEKRIGGAGPIVSDLEWDVKLYFALGGAVHDAAITCWDNKGHYDASRPISAIRYMCDRGQCSDPKGPSYHAEGMLLEPGLVEVVTPETTAPGERHEHLAGYEGKIAIYAWQGNPEDPDTQIGGVGWILAENWVPYQLASFVSPPFPGYFSGHSTYSRSSAQVLTEYTGSSYFPGGFGYWEFQANQYLTFELGPTETIQLQWAQYYDAADQAGISRIYGGIHPYFDDFRGRITGEVIGPAAYALAEEYWNGTSCKADITGDDREVNCDDLFVVINGWGACLPNGNPCFGDVKVNGNTDVDDIFEIILNWGPCQK